MERQQKSESKNGFEYDVVFRIRTDMAYKPSWLKDKLKYIENGLRHSTHALRDLNQIYVEYLKIQLYFNSVYSQCIYFICCLLIFIPRPDNASIVAFATAAFSRCISPSIPKFHFLDKG